MGKGIGMMVKGPITEQLEAAGTYAERAALLRRCPDSVFVHYCDEIRLAVVASGFTSALAYVWARVAALQATRLPDGRLPIQIEQTLSHADSMMGWQE
jgi:hypothetical protein